MISDPAFSTRLDTLLREACAFVGLIGFDEGTAVLASAGDVQAPVHDIRRLPESPIEIQSPLSGTVVLVARTLADLAQCSLYSEFLPTGRHLYIEVAQMAEPSRPTSIELPPTRPWRTMSEQRIRRARSGHWSIEIILDQPGRLAELVRACTAHRAPRARPLSPRVGVVGAAAQWAAGTSGYAITPLNAGDADTGNVYPAADLVLHSVPSPEVPTWGGHSRLVERRNAKPHAPFSLFPDHRRALHAEPHPRQLPPIDEYLVNPIGFQWDSIAEHPVMSFDGRGWSLHPLSAPSFSLPASGAVTDTEIDRCRRFRSVAVDWDSHPGDIAGAAAVASLAAAGVPLVSHGAVPFWARALGDDLFDLAGRYDTADMDDPLLRELHSVRLRRAAFAAHSSAARSGVLNGRPGSLGTDDTVSVILCTRRPTFLDSAFAQIASQRHEHVELVLVLHGITREHPEVQEALSTVRLPLRVVEVAASEPFGNALNAGVAAASGKYLTKFDDDDWYGPHHLPDLLLAARYSGGDLIGTQPEFVHLESPGLTVHKRPSPSERFAVHVSGATMLIRREDLVEMGGYRPLRTSEDRALLQDVQRRGGKVYCTHGLNFLISRRSSGHTWNAPLASFLRNSSRQWHGVDLGPAIAADTLEDHLKAQKGTAAP